MRVDSDCHAKRTGHTEFQDRTAEAAEEEARRVLENYYKKLAEVIEAQLGNLPQRVPVLEEEKDDEAKVKTTFNTLLTYAKNVATNPNEEKYRKIRLSNALFQDRVGKLQGGIEFLELCGFERIEGGEFLYLQR
ncbi:hypothetical protein RND71_022450 [Anisodus tanguticus]|uniref:PUB domain-containing protein n=1 Tax=Anisodus tanguticus TaxID=243964 RepID=A0AAE1RR27_9SOLA|nr:hypothetical protein RND71_022450 [Anisodus tanguticus]